MVSIIYHLDSFQTCGHRADTAVPQMTHRWVRYSKKLPCDYGKALRFLKNNVSFEFQVENISSSILQQWFVIITKYIIPRCLPDWLPTKANPLQEYAGSFRYPKKLNESTGLEFTNATYFLHIAISSWLQGGVVTTF